MSDVPLGHTVSNFRKQKVTEKPQIKPLCTITNSFDNRNENVPNYISNKTFLLTFILISKKLTRYQFVVNANKQPTSWNLNGYVFKQFIYQYFYSFYFF